MKIAVCNFKPNNISLLKFHDPAETQSVTGPNRSMYSFDLDSFDKYRLLNGLDDVGLTLELDNKIDAFRAQYQLKHSWANGHKIE